MALLNKLTLRDISDEELVLPGTSGCIGCGANLALRLSAKILGKNTIMINATGCTTVNVMYGATAFPFYHVAFENAASVASGIDAALKRLRKRDDINLVCFAGDGGTADIGFQALSGAIERGHKFTYMCYDNESYMNTGGQRSGTTPWGATTAVTPMGKFWEKLQRPPYLKKEMPKIIAAHGAPYVATASIAYPIDFMGKVKKALAVNGPAYIHIHCPCPTGWGFPENSTIKIGRLAVQTGAFILYEIDKGKLNVTVRIACRKPIQEYIKLQRRFAHLTQENIMQLQKWIDQRYQDFL